MIYSLKKHRVPEKLIDLFPFEAIIVQGLKSQSEHWSSAALKWALFVLRSTILEAALETLVKTGETQKIRHLAKKQPSN